MPKILFILKRREGYGEDCAGNLSTGLLNSSTFVHDMLVRSGVQSKLVVVTDNNDIDREVHQYQPTHVIIEALWVVPEKFSVLRKLHPNVRWIVRLHSNLPFLANEGIAMDWISRYVEQDSVYVAVNSLSLLADLKALQWPEDARKIIYLPNYYPDFYTRSVGKKKRERVIDIGCFGAIRPLKNHLQQAVAAIRFADSMQARLRFHINAARVEQKGESVVRNLDALFFNAGHELVKHDWLEHDAFLDLISSMDLCMQVSFSETFNIVAADSVRCGIPTIVSKEIPWARAGLADPTDTDCIIKALKWAWKFRSVNVYLNRAGLSAYIAKAKRAWLCPLP
jgi:hypothetical protein